MIGFASFAVTEGLPPPMHALRLGRRVLSHHSRLPSAARDSADTGSSQAALERVKAS